MSDLKTNLQSILNEKQQKILPENIKKNVTIFNVTGTYEGSGGGTVEGIKQFTSVEEMNNSSGNNEGDLAVVYRNEIQNITADSQFQTVTFPKTVVLPTVLTDYVDVRLVSVNASEYIECYGMLDASMFDFRFYGNTGSTSIRYTSTDGITYTKSGNAKTVDFGIEVTPHQEYWNDAIGYFMQVKSDVFDGLYIYENSSWKIAPNQLTVNTSNELLPGKIAYGKNGLVTGDNSVYSNINVNEYVNHLTNNAKFKTIPCITSEGITSSKLYSIENAEISEFNHVIVKDTLKQSSEIASEILTKIGVDVSLYDNAPSHYPISKDENYYYFLIMLYDSVNSGGYKYWIFKSSNLDYSDAVQIGEPFKASVIFSSAQIMTPVINNHIILLDLGYYDEPQFVDIDVANNTVTFQQVGTATIRDCYDSTLIGDKYVLFSYGDVCNNYIYKFNTGELVASTGLLPTTFDYISYSNAILLNDIYYVAMCYVVSSTRYIKLLKCDSTGGLQLADITSESATTAPKYVLTTVNDELYMFSSQLDSNATPTIIKINTANPSSSTRLTGFTFNYTAGVTSCTIDKNTLQYKLNNSVIMYASGLCVIDFTAKVITFKAGANLEVRFNYDNISEGVYGGVIRNNYVGVPNGYITIYLNKKLVTYTKPSSNGLAISLNSSSTNTDLLLLTDLT